MKVTGVDAIHVRVPEVREIADGTQDVLVVRVRTDEGVVGYGDVLSAPTVAKAVIEAPRSAILRHGLGVALLGANPLQPEACWQALFQASRWYGRQGVAIHALSGVDMALWDIVGKVAGKPLAEMWGKKRDRVRAYASVLFPDTPEQAAAMVEHFVGLGFTAIKFGFGSFGKEWAHDLKLMDAIHRAANGQCDIMVDSGREWTPDQAIERGRILFEKYGVLWLEEPLNEDDLDGYAKVTASIGTAGRVAAGEADATVTPFRRLLEAGVKVIQPDVSRAGGLTVCRQLSDLARSYGAWCIPHCFSTSITVAASMQWMGAAEEAVFCEFPVRDSPILNELVSNPPRLVDGQVLVPEGPGIGVEIDEQVLERYTVKRAAEVTA
jgi:L-rhamnonate dehydratase